MYSSIFLLIHIVYLNCNMLGTNKIVFVFAVVVELSEVRCKPLGQNKQ